MSLNDSNDVKLFVLSQRTITRSELHHGDRHMDGILHVSPFPGIGSFHSHLLVATEIQKLEG